MEWIASPEAWIALGTLVALELVLGIDNIVFISILVSKLPKPQQNKARLIGLGLAMGFRVLLLLSISWIVRLTHPLFQLFNHPISGRDLILILGGLFLLAKSTHEIHTRLEGEEGRASAQVKASFASVIVQIGLLDIIFSLDSVITAIGMVQEIEIMVIAVIAAIVAMMAFSGFIARFIERHPTVKILALSFLLLIGMMLIVEGFGHHIPKGYIYFAMAFSLLVETLNMRLRKVSAPVQLHEPYTEDTSAK